MQFDSECNSCGYFYAGNFPRTSFIVDFVLNPLSAITFKRYWSSIMI